MLWQDKEKSPQRRETAKAVVQVRISQSGQVLGPSISLIVGTLLTTDREFAMKRVKKLGKLLKKLCDHPASANSEEFKKFLGLDDSEEYARGLCLFVRCHSLTFPVRCWRRRTLVPWSRPDGTFGYGADWYMTRSGRCVLKKKKVFHVSIRDITLARASRCSAARKYAVICGPL